MKKSLAALLVIMMVASFAGCTQYDYSLLYRQLHQQHQGSGSGAQMEQDIENANIPGLFDATFNPSPENEGKVQISYSTEKPVAISMTRSSVRADVTEIYATAVYTDFNVGGNGIINGTLYYVFEVKAGDTNYVVTGYTSYVPEGTSLTLNIGGRSYEIDISVTETEATGLISQDGGEWNAEVELTAPEESDLVVSSEPVQTPSGALTSKQMIYDMLSQMLATNLVNAMISNAEPPVYSGAEDIGVELKKDILDGNDNAFGKLTYIFPEGIQEGERASSVSWATNNPGSINLDGISVSWTGSIVAKADGEGDAQTATVEFNEFLMSADNAPLPPEFEFSSIDGESSVIFGGEGSATLSGTVSYNGYTYSNEELSRSALLLALPMMMCGVSYPADQNSGNLSDLSETWLSVPLAAGTWTRTTDGGIEIEDGKVSYLGYTYIFELSLGPNVMEDSRSIDSFSFGASRPLESIDVSIFNFIMNS